MTTKVFVGNFCHSTWNNALESLDDTAMGISSGKITFIIPASKLETQLKSSPGAHVIKLKNSEVMFPGFVDTHIHASQYPNAGKALDLPLLDWLEKYTFPTEAKYSDLTYARAAYDKCVKRVLGNGTTTACYFTTIHTPATLLLCDIIGNQGQRALVGKVCMNQNCPDYMQEDTTESLEQTESFIKSVREKKNPLLRPIVTPRFAASCNETLLKGLGKIAKKYDTHIQSHVSENKDEVAWVKDLYPDRSSYTDVYRHAGLLTNKTILAHGIYLTNDELPMYVNSGAAISHCPNSNMSLCSGLCDVRRLLDHGVTVGLGTDVSGGYHPSILDAIRFAVQTSNILSIDKPDYRRLDYKEAFRLATLGGSKALAMEHRIGNFEIGKDFDAVRVDIRADGSPIDVSSDDSREDVFQKFIYLGDDRNIQQVYVAGRTVVNKLEEEDEPPSRYY